jgi:hypothetical protein
MEFTSQICTTEEQSKRLLALGLKRETADMSYFHTVGFEGNDLWLPSLSPYENVVKAPNYGEKTKIYIKSHTIPAWSLDRLISMIGDSNTSEDYKIEFYTKLNRYDEAIALIQSLIHIGQFNKEYLTE